MSSLPESTGNFMTFDVMDLPVSKKRSTPGVMDVAIVRTRTSSAPSGNGKSSTKLMRLALG